MYDLWYALGVTVIRPALIPSVARFAKFHFVRRALIETNPDGSRGWSTEGSIRTGNVEAEATENVRQAIAGFVKAYSHSAPPVSFFCAGRFCQLVSIPWFESGSKGTSTFKDLFDQFHQAYHQAIGAGAESTLPAFPAFLGLLTIDGKLVELLLHGAKSPQLLQILSEFGIVPESRDWDIAVAFASSRAFRLAAQLFTNGDGSQWNPGPCCDTMLFWDDDHSAHAIP